MAWRGHLSRNLKELRILLCQSSPASSEARAFIEKNYKDLKALNPKFPILIRECSGIEPQLWARYELKCYYYKDENVVLSWGRGDDVRDKSVLRKLCEIQDMGVERGIRLEGMKEAQIMKALEDLVKVGASLKA